MQLCQEKRGVYKDLEYFDETRVIVKYELPLSEIIYSFFDKLKSYTKGYASLDYDFLDYRSSDLAKMDILLNGDPVDALSSIVYRPEAYNRGLAMVSRLKDIIPRQQFEVPVQAAINGKIIARADIKAVRKDVLAKCYGGDISRKKKLLEKQKEGKKRMESSDPKLLGLMGRKHSYQDVVKAVAAVKEAGIGNINVDLIYALPGENADLLAQDISALLALDVPHLSTYSLILEDDSIFKAKGISEASEDVQAEQYEQILKALRAAGYDRYEVSNFCREGKMSRHNLVYWHDEPYYAAGLGASGYIGNLRYRNTRSLKKYRAGQWREEEESVTPIDDIHYFLLTGLRLESGISLKAFADRFGFSFLTKYPKEVLKLKEEGLLDQKGDSLFATDRGIMLLDRILEELF